MNAKLLTLRPLNKLLLCLPLAFWFSCASANEFEALDDIRATAEQFALTQVNDKNLSDIEAHTSRLDPRLQLSKCEESLQGFTTANFRNVVRTTIGVRCTGTKPWTLYLPVRISALAEVVYSVRTLVRGEILQARDLEIKQLPLNQLPANYLTSIDQLAGMEMTRSVNSGSVFTLNSVKIRKLVQRGQEVMILVTGSNVRVRMTGTALKNGASGELIPVRNLSSGRTIEAMVLNARTVVVNM